jgi:drug/metabolite transporter (DMT)-like permease
VTSRRPHRLAFAALLAGNAALAFGPWLVRLADVGPVAAGFWRLALAVPFLWLLARGVGQPVRLPSRALLLAIAGAALFFALDLASWHAGILLTKLGNATLFGNFASFAFAAYGLWLVRSWPTPLQSVALALAAAGTLLLMWGSYELSPRNLKGDLLALTAGLLYTGYLILIERARLVLKPLPLLILATIFGAPVLMLLSLALGEQLWPSDWTPLFVLALSSQVLGQGLLVYALGVLPPLVVGLALLTQPAISALTGWLAYGETLSPLDWVGAVAIGVALVLVRLPDRRLQPSPGAAS